MEIQKIEYLENKKSFLFLDDKKSLSTFFYGLPFGEKKKNRKKKKKNSGQNLTVTGLGPATLLKKRLWCLKIFKNTFT